MFKPLAILPVLVLTAFAFSCPVFAGGEMTEGYNRTSSVSARTIQTRQRIADLQAGLAQMEMSAALAAQAALDERAKKVSVVRPVKDKYGDPMYTWYGPLAVEAGTPMYDGPRYAASFDRGYMEPMPDGQYRGYARGRYSNPGLVSSHTDTILGVSANNSYMQHGMQVAPGSMAPSAARVMINNP